MGWPAAPCCVRLSVSFVAHEARLLSGFLFIQAPQALRPHHEGHLTPTETRQRADPPGEAPGSSAGALSLSRGDNSLSWCVISQTLENVKGGDSGAGCGWGLGCRCGPVWQAWMESGRGAWRERGAVGEEMTTQAPCPHPACSVVWASGGGVPPWRGGCSSGEFNHPAKKPRPPPAVVREEGP